MSKYLVGVFALLCLAAPLFATQDVPPPNEQAPAAATEQKKMDGDKKAAECKECEKASSECGCKKGKGKKKKS